MTRLRAVLAALTALALGLPAATTAAHSSPLAATTGPDGCLVVAFSPAAASDHLGLCVGYTTDFTTLSPQWTISYAVYATHDLGHTWLPVPGAGLVPDDWGNIGGLVFSPAYAVDHTVFLQTWTLDNGGVYASTDLGASWTLVDNTVNGEADDLKALAPSGVTGTPAALPTVVAVSRSVDDVLSRAAGPVHAPAAGSPDDDLELLPNAGLVLARTTDSNENDGTREHATLYGCDATLTCTTVKHAWARGELPERAWEAPDVATSHEVVVLTRGIDPHRTLHAWVSRDGGAHFAADAAANKVLAAAAARLGGHALASFTWRPGSPRTRYLRVMSQFPVRGTWDEVWRSTDRGASWRRLAYHSCTFTSQRTTCSGTMPGQLGAGYAVKHLADVTVLADGRLFVIADETTYDATTRTVETYFGTYCSVDDGKHWARSCAR
jgi:hypothetical protein